MQPGYSSDYYRYLLKPYKPKQGRHRGDQPPEIAGARAIKHAHRSNYKDQGAYDCGIRVNRHIPVPKENGDEFDTLLLAGFLKILHIEIGHRCSGSGSFLE